MRAYYVVMGNSTAMVLTQRPNGGEELLVTAPTVGAGWARAEKEARRQDPRARFTALPGWCARRETDTGGDRCWLTGGGSLK